jgi:hypothetical protein
MAELQREGDVRTRSVTVEHFDSERDGEFAAELHRLIEGSACESLAGDAGRETKIIFNSGRCARLAPKGAGKGITYRHSPLISGAIGCSRGDILSCRKMSALRAVSCSASMSTA